MSIVRSFAGFLLHRSGALGVLRWRTRNRVRVLMYHRFPDARVLARQCAMLTRHYRVLSLTEIADLLKSGDPLPANSACVTVDDGYRDFYAVAQSVFAKYGIRPTVYLITGFIDGEQWVWGDRITYAFRHTRQTQVRIELSSGPPLAFTLSAGSERIAAAQRVKEALKLMPNGERVKAVDRIVNDLGAGCPANPPEEYAPLTWDQIRELHRASVEFGGHTHTHPILSKIESAPEIDREIGLCKRRIEQELQAPVAHFCYPNGRNIDIGEQAVQAVRDNGYRTAVTTSVRFVPAGVDLLRVPRIGVDLTLPDRYFERLLAGVGVPA